MEADLVKRAGVPFHSIPAGQLHGVGLKALVGLVSLWRGMLKSRRILRAFKPSVLFFTGGYVAAPMALAARLVSPRPRSLVYVPDIEPGWALQFLIRLADHVALTVEDSRAYVPKTIPASVTGYPLRADLTPRSRASARRALGLQPDQPVFLVMGGSRGARSINQALTAALPELLPRMQILHITGTLDWQNIQEARQQLSPDLALRYHIYPYLHEQMGDALAAADLALSRAGASTLGEFPFYSLPALLVPYPYAWRYQKVNADYLVQRGAAIMIADEKLGELMKTTVMEHMADDSRRQAMSRAMQSLAQPEAARSIAAIITALAGNAS